MNEPDPESHGEQRPATAGEGGRRGSRKHRSKRGGTATRVSLVAVVVFAVVFVGVAGYLFLRTQAPPPDYSGRGTGVAVIEVDKGATVTRIGGTLERADVVKSSEAFVAAARDNKQATSIQPGHYQLHHKMAAKRALSMLLDPDSRIQARITIPEGKRRDEVFTIVARKTDISRRELKAAAKDNEALGLPSYAETVEGYLFPATYTVGPDATATKVLRSMVDEFTEVAGDLDLEKRARARGRSPHEVVTVASMVQGEVKNPRDFPKVAAVTYNRLDRGMPLEFSDTVNYALGQRKLGVSKRETTVDSPYNTYRHTGLPPGPVNSPGRRALEAALNPAQGDWLYFVTTNPRDGTTKFTSDYQQFLKFKQQFKRNSR